LKQILFLCLLQANNYLIVCSVYIFSVNTYSQGMRITKKLLNNLEIIFNLIFKFRLNKYKINLDFKTKIK
jgi:hypothetical protein